MKTLFKPLLTPFKMIIFSLSLIVCALLTRSCLSFINTPNVYKNASTFYTNIIEQGTGKISLITDGNVEITTNTEEHHRDEPN